MYNNEEIYIYEELFTPWKFTEIKKFTSHLDWTGLIGPEGRQATLPIQWPCDYICTILYYLYVTKYTSIYLYIGPARLSFTDWKEREK